jgi:DNA polymerase-3 subunit epsilon
MVEPALAPEQVWPLYLPVLADGVLTAHNLGFDYSFIQSEFARLEINFSKPIGQQLCTVTLSRLMLPDLPSRRLPDLVQHFDFQVGRSHRAEADTLACWFLAKLLLSEIQNLPDRVLLDRFAQQWLPLGDAAMLLGCSGKKARVLLEKAGVKPRLVGRHKTAVYQRGEVEQAYWKNVEPTQLSWL